MLFRSVEDLHELHPLGDDGPGLGEAGGVDRVDRQAERIERPGDDLAVVVEHDEAVLELGLEDILVALDVVLHDRGVHDDADGAAHVRDGEPVLGIVDLALELGADIFEVWQFRFVEWHEHLAADHEFGGVFGGLDEIIVAAARDELGEQLLVGGVSLKVDLDTGLLGETVEDRLRDVFGPAEQVEFFGGRQGGGAEREGGLGSEGAFQGFHDDVVG